MWQQGCAKTPQFIPSSELAPLLSEQHGRLADQVMTFWDFQMAFAVALTNSYQNWLVHRMEECSDRPGFRAIKAFVRDALLLV